MKEKIGIEKLIELLNEYDEIREYAEVDLEDELISLKIISKWYGFIKWLVENDKIDFDGIQNVFYRNKRYKEYRDYSDYESLLMLLSISDTPIEDLISYLK